MKRTLLSLMAVLLAFSPFHFTAIAEAQEVPTMRWLAQAGEKLFFFQNESKSLSYQVQGGALMQNPQLPVMSYAQRISTSQSSALFLFSNMVYSYTDGEPELLCTLAAYDPSKDLLLRALAANDVLYLLQGTTLYQFSLKTGELLAESSRYSDLCLGPNGAVFGWSYNMGTRQNELVPIQCGLEAGTPLCALDTYDNAGLAWDAATGWFYWTQGNTLYRWDGEQASPLSLMPFHANDIVQAYAAGRTYAVLLEQGQYDLYNLSSQGNEEQTVLRIKGMYTPMPGADMLFSLASGVLINREELGHYCAEDAFQSILTKDAATDLFYIPLSSAVYTMAERGYTVDLSDSAELAAYTATLYPPFAQAVTQGEQIIGMPINVAVCGWQMNANFADSIPVPQTWTDVLDLVESWTENAEDSSLPLLYDPGIRAGWTAYDYGDAIVTAFLREHLQAGTDMDFTDPSLWALLSRLRGMVERGILPAQEALPAEEGVFQLSRPSAGRARQGISLVNMVLTESSLLVDAPTFAPGGDAIIPAYASIYIINPYSQHKQEAMDYLAHLAQNLVLDDASLLQQTFENTLTPSAQEQKAQLQEQLEQQELCMALAQLEASPSSWSVLPERLDAYRNRMIPQVSLQTCALLEDAMYSHLDAYSLLTDALHQYIEGQMDENQCANRMGELSQSILQEMN